MKRISIVFCSFLAHLLSIFVTNSALAHKASDQDLLIKFREASPQNMELLSGFKSKNQKLEVLSEKWIRLKGPVEKITPEAVEALRIDPSVEYIQPNYKIDIMHDYQMHDPLRRAAFLRALANDSNKKSIPKKDNPDFLKIPTALSGADPLVSEQWGLSSIGALDLGKLPPARAEIIVAVLDTGIDYLHEDLIGNLWNNPKEIPGNGIDDDGNGYIDDIIGWDFASNDNKPYDLSVGVKDMLFKGGNPGHGTHCAGTIAASTGNALGISGVAPNVKIMALRFMRERGGGTTADAVRAIHYAVDNGAKITSNSWGSEGEDEESGEENRALRDAIDYAQQKGVLFIAAAGNGHKGKGYDNDTDKAPAYPASYENDNIISVAAIDRRDRKGSFSNWGAKSVDIGAPGVAIFSTTVGNQYDDAVFGIGGFRITWDGTSMAAPFVAGAAALYWSQNPNKSWRAVKEEILDTAKPIASLKGKTVTGGKLDLKKLLD